jgi:hypothetical protein
MRTLLILLLVCVFSACRGQVDTTLNKHFISIQARSNLLGEDIRYTNTVSYISLFKRDVPVLFINTKKKVTVWHLRFINQRSIDHITVDSYSSLDRNGVTVIVRFTYEYNELVDISFSKYFSTIRFYIINQKSL